MIYTSYFANWRKLKKANIQIVSIARVNPPNLRVCPMVKAFAPSSRLLYDFKYEGITWEEYTERYIRELQQIENSKIRGILDLLESHYKNIALCCYEKPTDHCHRHILAEYISTELDIDIEEF